MEDYGYTTLSQASMLKQCSMRPDLADPEKWAFMHWINEHMYVN